MLIFHSITTTLLFIYSLFAIRISITQCLLLIGLYECHLNRGFYNKKNDLFIELPQPIPFGKCISNAIKSIVFWPKDLIKIPDIFLKVYFLNNRLASGELGFYYFTKNRLPKKNQ